MQFASFTVPFAAGTRPPHLHQEHTHLPSSSGRCFHTLRRFVGVLLSSRLSNLTAPPTPDRCASENAEGSTLESFPARSAKVGDLEIRRALPARGRRMVGPWCFLDRYGPLTFTDAKPMDVAPHPHIGLQTVSWLLEGEVLHRDSLGFEAMIRPGELNLMTAGRGIAHSEETARTSSGRLSGVQLWIALPDSARHREPAFAHHDRLPVHDLREGIATVLLGDSGDLRSPASVFSDVVGLDLVLRGAITIPLRPHREHALLVLEGDVELEGQHLQPDILTFLGTQRDQLELRSKNARALLIGGRPFGESILMWWNFVGRTHEEIAAAREDWIQHARFGEVSGYQGSRMPAPPLIGRASPPAAS